MVQLFGSKSSNSSVRMETEEDECTKQDSGRKERFRDRFVYSLHVAVVVYLSVVIVLGTECLTVFLKYYPLI